jgi:hypothetical protein
MRMTPSRTLIFLFSPRCMMLPLVHRCCVAVSPSSPLTGKSGDQVNMDPE